MKLSANKEESGTVITAEANPNTNTGSNNNNNTSNRHSSAAKTESKVAKIDAKKNETTIFYLAKRESTKKVLQCLQSMVEATPAGDNGEDSTASTVTDTDFLNKKIFSNDLDVIKDFLLQEGE